VTYAQTWPTQEEYEAAFMCLDCGSDTRRMPGGLELYMVRHDLYESVVPGRRGMLCIGCLEGRLGRELTADDFPDLPINEPRPGTDSPRLIDRLSRTRR
jgi:hypothetical protein